MEGLSQYYRMFQREYQFIPIRDHGDSEVPCSALPSRYPATVNPCFLRSTVIFLPTSCFPLTASSQSLSVRVVMEPDNSYPMQDSSIVKLLLWDPPCLPPLALIRLSRNCTEVQTKFLLLSPPFYLIPLPSCFPFTGITYAL